MKSDISKWEEFKTKSLNDSVYRKMYKNKDSVISVIFSKDKFWNWVVMGKDNQIVYSGQEKDIDIAKLKSDIRISEVYNSSSGFFEL